MSCEEHYFENLLFYGEDCKDNYNKNTLSLEVQQAIETCADYVLYTIFMTRENFLAYVREDNARPQGEWIFTCIGYYKCSNCGEVERAERNYCPNCGAQMLRGEKNDAERP